MNRLFLIICLTFTTVFGQHTNWTVTPRENLGFTENLDRYEPFMDEEFSFYANYGAHQLLFSSDAIVFRKREELGREEVKERYEKEEHGIPVEPIGWNNFKIEFIDINEQVEIQPRNKKIHTRNFIDPLNPDRIVRASAFDTLYYKNIYPNIDLEFYLPQEGGLKYQFIVHPGGDYRQIRMKYTGAEITKNAKGNIIISSDLALFEDQAPISLANNQAIPTSFKIVKNQVGFEVEDYDADEILVIDPWIVTPLPDLNGGLEIAADNAGNVVVYVAIDMVYSELYYYNSLGDLQWTYGLFRLGDVYMQPETGDVYNCAGQNIKKFDPFGTLMGSNDLDAELVVYEAWRVKYSSFHDEVILGEGGIEEAFRHVAYLDTDLSTYESIEVFPDPDSNMEDCVLFDVDEEDGSIYFLPAAAGFESIYGNILYKLDAFDPTSIIWETYSGYFFRELDCATYLPYILTGVNGITIGESHVYTYNGHRLLKFDKSSGAIIDSVFTDDPEEAQYGIDIDNCGNLYLGGSDKVLKLSKDLETLAEYPTIGPCRDLIIIEDTLYVTGDSFVSAITLETSGIVLNPLSTPDYCESCNGTASVGFTLCEEYVETEFFDILWEETGSTDLTINGLCAGWYTVTVTFENEDGELITATDSVEVIAQTKDILVTTTVSNETCPGDCDGAVEIMPISGDAPFLFTIDDESNITGEFTDLCPDFYEVSVIDSNGCEGVFSFVVAPTLLPTVSFDADTIEGCVPLTVVFSNTGDFGISNEWNFGDGTSSMEPGPVYHTYKEAGEYDVSLVITSSIGCMAQLNKENLIIVHPNPIANFIFDPQLPTTLDTEVEFTNFSTGEVSWIWSFDYLGSSADENPNFTFPAKGAQYTIELIVTSEAGCKDSVEKILRIEQEQLIFAPNVITPDGNSYNEVFKPYFEGFNIYDYHLVIYNRWGEILFESFDQEVGWNGTYNGEIVQDGVYIWLIETADIDTDKKHKFNGHVTVIR